MGGMNKKEKGRRLVVGLAAFFGGGCMIELCQIEIEKNKSSH